MAESVVLYVNSTTKLCRYLGLFPFYLSNEGQLIVSKLWSTWAVLVLTVFTCSSTYSLFAFEVKSTSALSVILNYFELFIFLILICAHLIWIFVNKKLLEVSFRPLLTLELELIKPSLWPPCLAYLGIFGLTVMQCLMFPSIKHIYVSIVDYTQTAFAFAVIFQFTDLLQIYRQAFIKLANSCRKCEEVGKPFLLRQFELNEEVVDCCETLSYCFGPALLIMILSSFIIISSSLFAVYDFWSDKTEVSVSCVWIVLYLCQFRHLVNACENSSAAANQFYSSLLQAVTKDNQLSNDHTFGLLLMMRKILKLTAFGYFFIDYGIFCSMLAASVTYFVVFIEFNHNASERKAGPTDLI
ncbi:uncharacterized protein isoform X2 [Rhodnius prolixus]|uniref:uncharacterized protein isoform X2 n=1 Tax=Rhodnius prolixus TaxID=13249 RepID=UPI003D18E8D4